MPSGGRRPGAGAPRGNMNGLKTGAHSPRVRAVVEALMQDPEARAVLLKLGASAQARNHAARELGIAIARFMHDHPIADEARNQIEQAADAAQLAHDTRQVLTEIAEFEQRTGLDAFTRQALNGRPARRSPAQLERTARIIARVRRMNRLLQTRDAVEKKDPGRLIPVMEAWFAGDGEDNTAPPEDTAPIPPWRHFTQPIE